MGGARCAGLFTCMILLQRHFYLRSSAFGQPSWKSSNTLFYLHEHDESIHNQSFTK
jgi:hypothetical protein